jgi:hypothetical protein
MKRARKAFRRLAGMIFPWPGSHERKAAVTAAQREKEHSQACAEAAADIGQQIRHLARENHFAETITAQIIGACSDTHSRCPIRKPNRGGGGQ